MIKSTFTRRKPWEIPIWVGLTLLVGASVGRGQDADKIGEPPAPPPPQNVLTNPPVAPPSSERDLTNPVVRMPPELGSEVPGLSQAAIPAAPAYQSIYSYPPVPLPPGYGGLGTGVPNIAGTSQLSVPSMVPLPPLEPLLQYGKLTVQSHLAYRLSYGDGVQATPGQQARTLINELLPGAFFNWGGHWSLDYTPTLRFYSSSLFRDTLEHAVNLTGTATYEDWSFGLSQGYASYSTPLVETASQTDQETYSTALSAICQLGSKTSLQLGASQNLRFVDQSVLGNQLANVRSWGTMDWLNYQFWTRFSAAVGVGFGYDNVDSSPDMTSEQFQGRVSWVATEKISLVLTGGAEERQFMDSNAPDLLIPVFSFSAQYSPFDVTTFSVTASQSVSPSYFQAEVTENASISAGLRQRLLGRLFLNLNGGYSTITYHSSLPGPFLVTQSNYDATFFSVSLSTSFLKRCTATLFYNANYINSSASLFNYTTSQVGLELGARF